MRFGARLPEPGDDGQTSARVLRGTGRLPAREMGANHPPPTPGGQRQRAGHGQGPGQARGLAFRRQAQRGKGTEGMGMVVGMARGVQHHRRGEPVRGVPAVLQAHRLQPPVGHAGAGQAGVLDIIRQQNLGLRMQAQAKPDQKPRQARNRKGQHQRGQAARDVKEIGMQAQTAAATAQLAFGPQPLDETARPGARGKAVEPLARAGAVRVLVAGDMAVVDQPVRAGVLAEQKRHIDRRTQPEQLAPRAMNQLMRGGMGDLAQPEAGGEKQERSLPGRKRAGSGNGPGRKRQDAQRADAHRYQKDVGGGKLVPLGRARGERDQLVEDDRQHRHVKEGRPEPDPAQPRPEEQERQGQQGGKREADQRQGSGRMSHCRRGLQGIGADGWGFWRPMQLP